MPLTTQRLRNFDRIVLYFRWARDSLVASALGDSDKGITMRPPISEQHGTKESVIGSSQHPHMSDTSSVLIDCDLFSIPAVYNPLDFQQHSKEQSYRRGNHGRRCSDFQQFRVESYVE
jgi:hypothetical protein